jgi:hypothetical protein
VSQLDAQIEPGKILFQTPQARELVSHKQVRPGCGQQIIEDIQRATDWLRGTWASNHSMTDKSFDPTTPVKSLIPIRMPGALDKHPLVADILLSGAKELSTEAEKEVVILVAHGPVPDDDNAKWLQTSD